MTTAGSARLSKHSLSIAGHRTSVSLEQVFWAALGAIAARRGLTVAALVARIDRDRGEANLSSAIRVFVFETAGRFPELVPANAAA